MGLGAVGRVHFSAGTAGQVKENGVCGQALVRLALRLQQALTFGPQATGCR